MSSPAEILPNVEIIYTSAACDACDKYHVCLRALARVSSEVNEGNGRPDAVVKQQPKVICTLLIELDYSLHYVAIESN